MAAVTFESPRSSLNTYRSQKSNTQAKHTLFGTSLEPFTAAELTDINNIDVNHYTNSNIPYKSPELSDRQQQYENQKCRVREAEEEVIRARTKALTFRTTPQQSKNTHRKPNDSQTLMELLNPKPSEETSMANQNRYQLMGDVFTSVGDPSIVKERSPRDLNVRYGRRSSGNKGFTSDFLVHHNTNENCNIKKNGGSSDKEAMSLLQLPPNIRHSVGSRICDELFSDVDKIHRTVQRQNDLKGLRSRRPQEEIATLLTVPLNDYEDLGHSTRMNLFPGLSTDNKISVMKTNYSDSVFLNRVPDSDQNRMRKDQLSTWAESNVLRERMKKAWEEKADKKQ